MVRPLRLDLSGHQNFFVSLYYLLIRHGVRLTKYQYDCDFEFDAKFIPIKDSQFSQENSQNVHRKNPPDFLTRPFLIIKLCTFLGQQKALK